MELRCGRDGDSSHSDQFAVRTADSPACTPIASSRLPAPCRSTGGSSGRIGACTSQALTSCRYSTYGFLNLSTKNVTAKRIAEQLTSTRIFAGGEVQNNGSTASGTFRTDLYINRALLDPSGVCATNLGSSVVLATDYVTTATGLSVKVQAADVPGAVGITRDGSLNWFAKAEAFASVGLE